MKNVTPRKGRRQSSRHEQRWMLLRAVAAILIGSMALVFPVASSLSVGLMVGFALLSFGFLTIAAGLSAKPREWLDVGLGFAAVAAGASGMITPLSAILTLTWMTGAWLLLAGLCSLIMASRRKQARGWLVAIGLFDLLLGSLLLASGPSEAPIYVAAMLGISLIARGVFLGTIALDRPPSTRR